MKNKPVKYITYDDDDDRSAHWEYCRKNKVPYIVISEHSPGFSNVSYDLFHCDIPDAKLDTVFEVFIGIYLSLQIFLRIPQEIALLTGGRRCAGLIVRNQHSVFIAENMFDYFVHI